MTPPISPDRVRQLLGVEQPHEEGHRRIDNLGRWVKAKLSPEQRAEIRAAHARGEKCQLIANRFGVSVAYVSMLGNGQRGAK